MSRLVSSLIAVSFLAASALPAAADDHKGKGKHGHHNDRHSNYYQPRKGGDTIIYQYYGVPVTRANPGRGFGVGQIPPGHRTYYQPGRRLRPDERYVMIYPYEYDYYRLAPLRPGEAYVRIDNDILRIMRDTATVIDAVGIIGRALN